MSPCSSACRLWLLLTLCYLVVGSTASHDLAATARSSGTVALPVLALLDLSSTDYDRRQPLPNDGGSSLLLRTAQTAVAEVNRRQLIPGHHLELHVNDSKARSSVLFCQRSLEGPISIEKHFGISFGSCQDNETHKSKKKRQKAINKGRPWRIS